MLYLFHYSYCCCFTARFSIFHAMPLLFAYAFAAYAAIAADAFAC